MAMSLIKLAGFDGSEYVVRVASIEAIERKADADRVTVFLSNGEWIWIPNDSAASLFDALSLQSMPSLP
jgi:uncharacterized protein YlzI (FlbEa/FlbD family)